MNNYEYIIASLPTVNDSDRSAPGLDADREIEEIRRELSSEDLKLFDFFLKSYDPGSLDQDFYLQALKSKNAFTREFCLFDLYVRNAKVEYLNSELGRPEGCDMIGIAQGEDFEEKDRLDAILHSQDILEREKGMDALMWEKASELTVLENFNLNFILGAMVKMKIIDRWLKLDAESGRELFRKFVDEIRNSKKI